MPCHLRELSFPSCFAESGSEESQKALGAAMGVPIFNMGDGTVPKEAGARADLSKKMLQDLTLVLQKAQEAGNELSKAATNFSYKKDRMANLTIAMKEAGTEANQFKDFVDKASFMVRQMMRDPDQQCVGVPEALWPLLRPPPVHQRKRSDGRHQSSLIAFL
mmetsp:Transcript_90779/g.143460  ORF Transcript_90779/g.143460 Transcript_90779/m.143460 type:complete len:162 (-) Transcript_90779:61-546(-)